VPVLINLQVCCLVAEANVNQTKYSLTELLPEDRYTLTVVSDLEFLLSLLTKSQNAQDCLVIFGDTNGDVETIVDRLGMVDIFMPTILVLKNLYEQSEHHFEQSDVHFVQSDAKDFYRASISISIDQIHDLSTIIDQAIATFIKISPQIRHQIYVNIPDTPVSESLSVQQQRLADKLNERLGYLGVYYKRDSQSFLRNLFPEDKKDYIERLKRVYRLIVLEYFSQKNSNLNQNIDEFVNLSFFADLSISQVLEIHMELMDELAKRQFKNEMQRLEIFA